VASNRLAPAWANGTSTKSAVFNQVDYFLIVQDRFDAKPAHHHLQADFSDTTLRLPDIDDP
jgi:hypothetical protein